MFIALYMGKELMMPIHHIGKLIELSETICRIILRGSYGMRF